MRQQAPALVKRHCPYCVKQTAQQPIPGGVQLYRCQECQATFN